MAIITEVEFGHDEGALADTLEELPDLRVTILRETSTGRGQSTYFLRLDHGDPEEVRRVLGRDRTVSEATPMPGVDGQQLWGVAFAERAKLLAPRVTREGGFVIDARSTAPGTDPRGWRERWLLPDRQAVHDIWSYARDAGFDFGIVELERGGDSHTVHPASEALTDHQRAALRAALEQGYFTEPRETSLEGLAETLDLSPSAVSGRLKRGMKTLIGNTLIIGRREG